MTDIKLKETTRIFFRSCTYFKFCFLCFSSIPEVLGVKGPTWTSNTLEENHLGTKKQRRNVVHIEVDLSTPLSIQLNLNKFTITYMYNGILKSF